MSRRFAARHVAAVVALAHLASALPSGAQSSPELGLSPGARVRIQSSAPAGNLRFTGTLAAERSDSLFVTTLPGATRAVARDQVERLWISRGRTARGTRRGLVWGTLIGGLALGGAAAISEMGCTDKPGGFGLSCWGVGPVFAIGFAMGGAAGALVGGIVGYNVRTERWHRLR